METGTLRSHDGTHLARITWRPEGAARGRIVLVHGVGEHLGRYRHVAAHLVGAGYEVDGVEFRGHGGSEGKRGHVDEWERYVEDLRTVIDAEPGPYAIVAHSMGTLVSLDHLRDASPWGLVASACTVGVAVEAPRWKLLAARVLSRVLPRLSMGNEIPPSHLCTDEAVVAAYLADPAVFSTITPRWYTEFLAAIERVQAAAAHYTVPALVPYGTDDHIISVDALEEFAARYGAGMELAPYPGMRHEVLNEPVSAEVLARISAWLDARNPGPSA